jgi:PTH1 family peptidyl-tRNA hydrolase
MKFLITGLGNIGAEYELTRHNAGFLVVDQLADKFDVQFVTDRYARKALIRHKGRQIHLIKPSTYMNLSGNAVNYWLQALKIPLEHLLVVTDDIALPLGKLRMRAKGSDAGHNGLKHIVEVLGTNQFPRLRVGIGNDFLRGQQIDYVLGKWKEEELKVMEPVWEKACDMILGFCTIGIDRTMSRYND